LRQISVTGTPSSPCFKMNAFCASENLEAFIASAPSSSLENHAENSNQNRSSFKGSQQFNIAPNLLDRDFNTRRSWNTRRQAEMEIFEYINGFYNPRRLHSAVGRKSPAAFERKAA